MDKIEGVVNESRQVFDLPPIEIYVTEYQSIKKECTKCNQINYGEFPQNVLAPTQYGERIKAFCVMMNIDYKVPFQKIGGLIKDLVGIDINESTLINANKKCFELLSPSEEQIKLNLKNSLLVNADETGINISKKIYWVHNVSNEKCTYQFIHSKRGIEAMQDEKSILSEYKGIVVHDCWASYFKLEKIEHAICGAHIIRELNALIEQGIQWASKFSEFYKGIYGNSVSQNNRNRKKILSKYSQILYQGIIEEPLPQRNGKRGRLKKSKGLNLILRLKEYKKNVMSFAFDESIPFTNNQAERDLRHCKTKLKIAGCFRTVEGAQQYARISSFSSTLRKNSINVLETLTSIFKGESVSLDLT